jgi:hypothetical protein
MPMKKKPKAPAAGMLGRKISKMAENMPLEQVARTRATPKAQTKKPGTHRGAKNPAKKKAA